MAKKYKNKKKGRRTDKQIKKLARSAIASMKPMKRVAFDNLNMREDMSSNQWIVWQPTFIAGNAGGSDQENTRMSNQCWIQRCSGIVNIQPSTQTLHPIEIREMCGWYKGSTSGTQAAINSFNAGHLNTSFPNRLTRYDPDNFKIIKDRFFTVCPRQIYDSSSGDSTGENSHVLNDNLAVWAPVTIKCTFKLNKVFRYSDATDGGGEESLVTDAGSQVGWKPFIALQLRCPNHNWNTMTHPAPLIDSKFTTYFKDNV